MTSGWLIGWSQERTRSITFIGSAVGHIHRLGQPRSRTGSWCEGTAWWCLLSHLETCLGIPTWQSYLICLTPKSKWWVLIQFKVIKKKTTQKKCSDEITVSRLVSKGGKSIVSETGKKQKQNTSIKIIFLCWEMWFKTMTSISCLHQLLKIAIGVFALVSPGHRLWNHLPLYTEQLHPKGRKAGIQCGSIIQKSEGPALSFFDNFEDSFYGIVSPSLPSTFFHSSTCISCTPTVFWAPERGTKEKALSWRLSSPSICSEISTKLCNSSVCWGWT